MLEHQADAALLRRLPETAGTVEPDIFGRAADADAALQLRAFQQPGDGAQHAGLAAA